jgi:hypothetical protein
MEHKFVLFKLAPINQCHVGHEFQTSHLSQP